MPAYSSYLNWIDTQQEEMASLVETWANINSWSENLVGLNTLLLTLQKHFSILDGKTQILTLPSRKLLGKQGLMIEVPLGQAISIRKRPEAPIQVFLGGHMDTVYPPFVPFQKVEHLDNHTFRGPGVTDLKGGLAIMLKALQALERSPYTSQIGWEILINPDEEIGSPGSASLFTEAAKRHQVGLIFEPSFADGAFVSMRKGSANFSIVARGQAAHAGRDFHMGRNSIYAIAHVLREIETLNNNNIGTTINVGHIEGGGPVNIVPDLAICHLNIRARLSADMLQTKKEIQEIVQAYQPDGITIELIEESFRLPKPFDIKTQRLFEAYKDCADELHIPFQLRESGGACDGNILSEAGLPTLDSIGAIGGKIHTDEEYLLLDSLTQRAKLTALFLFKLATHETEFSIRDEE